MSENDHNSGAKKRRSKRFLTPSQKYEIWLQLVRQEVTMAEAASRERVDQRAREGVRTGTSRNSLNRSCLT